MEASGSIAILFLSAYLFRHTLIYFKETIAGHLLCHEKRVKLMKQQQLHDIITHVDRLSPYFV